MSEDTNLPETVEDTSEVPTVAETEPPKPAREIGGPKEADPTRYGDWTVKGRCIDF